MVLRVSVTCEVTIGWPALVKVPGRILLVVGIFRRQAIDRHDHLVAALRQLRTGPDAYTLKRSATDDRRLDVVRFEFFFQVRSEKLVRTALPLPFAITRRDSRVDHVRGRGLIIAAHKAVPDHHSRLARSVMQTLHVRNGGHAARALAAVGLHQVQNQHRCGGRIQRHGLDLRLRGSLCAVPIVEDVARTRHGDRSHQHSQQCSTAQDSSHVRHTSSSWELIGIRRLARNIPRKDVLSLVPLGLFLAN